MMWRKWARMVSLEMEWMKRDIIRRWRLDTPIGVMGILLLVSFILLFIVIGGGFAYIFRLFVPWVSGARVGDVYWYSLGLGIKVSFLLLLFIGSLVMFFLLKINERR
ncbi:hypothetical protein [Desulfosporosinus hippei]|uniref:Uncharacterized protein n=1 Tax=Desulfosporosinus hippei DSM 8344 TaxID=1121419 RepID=A0A1G8KEY7_9FIRM|nr:hypothetical protein [Desulfosporosinus hippei]SDI41994.1 hypothetical protein SAMN05443529_1382 [Desulfosporosinus hippei DSM 8344]